MLQKLFTYLATWLMMYFIVQNKAAPLVSELQTTISFKACFQASMQKLMEEDSSLAVLLNPGTDPAVITAALPDMKINLTDVPTELTEDSLPNSENTVDFIKDSNSSSANFSKNSITISKILLGKEIRYLLFTKENKDQFQVMSRDGNTEGTNWRPERKTKVIIHGLTSTVWQDSLVNIWSQHTFKIKDAYLKKSPDASLYNVIVVDWTTLSTVPLAFYPDAALGTKKAGEDIRTFLLKLRESKRIMNWKDVHLIGHSLGSHVAGITGNKFRKMGNEYSLERITGLDPAGLCFDTLSGNVENYDSILDSSDANFVDIIHTNAGNVITSVAGRYGSLMTVAHADFFPNGGEVQPGCSFLEDRCFCSHQQSVIFFANSIWDKALACPCSSWDVFRSGTCNCTIKTGGYYMGEHCNNTARGTFFLNT